MGTLTGCGGCQHGCVEQSSGKQQTAGAALRVLRQNKQQNKQRVDACQSYLHKNLSDGDVIN